MTRRITSTPHSRWWPHRTLLPMSSGQFYWRNSVAICTKNSTPVVEIHRLVISRQELTCHPVWWWSLLTWTSARCPRRLQSHRWLGLSCHRSCVTRAGWRCSGRGWTGRTAAADAAPSARARWLRRGVTDGNIFTKRRNNQRNIRTDTRCSK